MQWNKIKVSVHTVNIWHFTEMKERRKVKVEEQQKKTCIWNIRGFVNLWKLEYSIQKTSECFATDTNTKRMYWKKCLLINNNLLIAI